jgi:outer membrane protein assembly factor BamD
MNNVFRFQFTRLVMVLLVAAVTGAACAGKKDEVPTGAGAADKFLFDKGTESLNENRWFTAREYYRRLIDGYPQSDYRPDAKLGIADSYLGEGTLESLMLAVNEYREFLTFYPTNARADYAQYKLGMTHHKQMRGPQRDQTETREAIREFETFMERYPNSPLKPEVQEKLREARDRLSQSEYQIGYFYYRQRWYPGAIDRLRALLKADPGFTNRDAAYYHLAESLLKVRLDAEALPLYEKLLEEFEQSEYLEEARLRVTELRAAMQKAGAPPPAASGEGAATTVQTPAPSTNPASAPPQSQVVGPQPK